jgi:acetyl esterase
MPLDEDSRTLLEERRRQNIPPVAAMSLDDLRASREAWRTRSAVAGVSVHETAEHAVPVAGGAIRVRLYRPSAAAALPAILYLHGGGWVLGDLEHSDALCRHLCAEAGCVVANVDYRLAPEHRFPTAVEDGYAALGWLGRQPGVDPARIAVAGSSAGGNLAAAIALMARDRAGPAIRAQLLVYPVLDAACGFPSYAAFAEGFIVSTEDMRWYWRQYLRLAADADGPYACPLRAADLSELPPALVITAECDPVRDDGERYAERLRGAGVPVRRTRYPGTLHGFFAMPGRFPKASAAIREAAAFLRAELSGSPA